MDALVLPLPRVHAIDKVAVVMPAHNEAEHLGRALHGVQRAADAMHWHRPEVDVRVTVVLDSCTDGSAALTAGFAAADRRFSALEVSFRSAGASRAAGIKAAGIGGARRPPPGKRRTPLHWAGRTWLANTDADSEVPENWLVRQLEIAESGADAVLGSVEPDPTGMDPEVLRRWLERHPFEEDHPHVYGANFGVRASAYLAAGGFPMLASHEDRTLVQSLRSRAFTITATDSIRVLTSGRTRARAPHGFGAYLRTLGEPLQAAAGPPPRE
ncbi:MAG: glycosyl transferase [Arthrobacter sp.]|nr:glycosyl transferase [Arthrobacter sp.]